MTFSLGANSRAALRGVHPALVSVIERAIVVTSQDFVVFEGLRTLARQQQLVAKGASKTLKSMHLPQTDGYGHASDLLPWIDGAPRWEWGPIYPIAAAMQQAAKDLNVPMVWGGVWDRPLSALPAGPEGMKAAVAEYCQRHPGPDFIDGPHFQLGNP